MKKDIVRIVDRGIVPDDTIRRNKTFFHLIFPVFILALIPSEFSGNWIYPLVIKILILIWEYIALKNFVESTI